MIYITGDIHGKTKRITDFAEKFDVNENDVIILLGDVGANYYGGEKDHRMKTELSQIKATILCIHGNHEMRPCTIPTYKTKEWNGGVVWYEEEYQYLCLLKFAPLWRRTLAPRKIHRSRRFGVAICGVAPRQFCVEKYPALQQLVFLGQVVVWHAPKSRFSFFPWRVLRTLLALTC